MDTASLCTSVTHSAVWPRASARIGELVASWTRRLFGLNQGGFYAPSRAGESARSEALAWAAMPQRREAANLQGPRPSPAPPTLKMSQRVKGATPRSTRADLMRMPARRRARADCTSRPLRRSRSVNGRASPPCLIARRPRRPPDRNRAVIRGHLTLGSRVAASGGIFRLRPALCGLLLRWRGMVSCPSPAGAGGAPHGSPEDPGPRERHHDVIPHPTAQRLAGPHGPARHHVHLRVCRDVACAGRQ